MEQDILRKAQLVQLEIAKEIKRVCDENGIRYFLDSGSLLGAVRHKGFIPWDDDMDIGMLREDYERFIELAPKALKNEYELIDWKLVPEYPHPFAKVMRKNTIYLEEAVGKAEKCGFFVDVFPYDSVCPDDKLFDRYRKRLMLYRGLIRAKCNLSTWKSHNHFNIKIWLRNIPFIILSKFFPKKGLIEKYEKIAKINNEKPCEKLYEQAGGNYLDWQIPRECFEDFIEIPFENIQFNVPKNYDLYLKSSYGDYMKYPPESERQNLHSIIKIDFGDVLSEIEDET